jgi:uncharacterized membrane protein (TIGR02234 family)
VVASAIVSVVAGAATARYGGEWAVMGQRYDAPAAEGRRPATEKPADELTDTDVWQAIDQGRDPTREL